MNKKKMIVLAVAGILTLVVGLGAAAFKTVNAMAAPVASAAANVASSVAVNGRGMRGGYTQEDLAAALGIDVAKLQEAYTTANAAALKQAVEQDLLTQTQADALAERGLTMRGGREFGWLAENGIDFDSLLADALGISVDKLQAAYATAFTTAIDQAVTDGNITQAQADEAKARFALQNNSDFQNALKSAYEAALSQAVKSGVITQAQADVILQGKDAKMGFPGFPGMDGDRGGFGGGRHGGRGGMFDGPAEAPVTPETTTGNGA